MFDFLKKSFMRGVRRLDRHRQLAYTLFMAAIILAAFIYMATLFLGIARDAQEDLYDVRRATLQDAFVQFAHDELYNTSELNSAIENIARLNTSIREFKVIDRRGSEPVIVAALNEDAVGSQPDVSQEVHSRTALFDPASSGVRETQKDGERFFENVRAISNPDTGDVVAISLIRHTLSAADTAVERDIRNSIILFAVVMGVVMILFFRHSRIVDYATLYRKLKEVDRLKDDFISMASHELRTPLTIIRGYAEFLSDSPLDTEQRNNVDNIKAAAQHLDNLVADMLDVSRIEQGRMSYEYEPCDPADLLADVSEQFEARAEEKGLDLSYENDGTASIETDPGRLKQVLINLVGNAVKYTKEGEVRIKSYVENEKQIIRVSDTGVGMSKEEQDQLFHKFARVGDTRTKRIRGTGLGLWISKQIVEEMEGTITVESIKGKGSDFILKFAVAH